VRGNDSSVFVFVFEPLKVGHYSVTVTAPGFKSSTISGIELNVARRLEADVRLEVGGNDESVDVSAEFVPLLQTQDASTGQVVSQKQINDIPLNQRNYVFLAQLSTSVAPSNGGRGAGNGDFNANGERETQNNFILSRLGSLGFVRSAWIHWGVAGCPRSWVTEEWADSFRLGAARKQSGWS
jgi:hypothetical protein